MVPGQGNKSWQAIGGGFYDIGLFGDHPFVPEGEPAKELIDTLFHGHGGRGVGDEGWYGFLPYSVDHVIKFLGTYKEFVMQGRFVLSLGFNVYNLFNSQRPISFVKEDTELFGQVWGRQLPRWLQLKAVLRF